MTLPLALIGGVLAAATSLHYPVSTTNVQAQAAMDRGLFLYYAYDREAAHASFATAAAHDPHLAIAFWGLALADGPDLNTPMTQSQFDVGRKDIAAAVAREAGATNIERGLIDALSLRFATSFREWQNGDPAYADAMERFATQTNDENARLLAAEALLEVGADYRTALSFVAGVLRDDPSSAMANHLCLHLYDLAPDRRPAKACAQRLDAAHFSPEAEHLAHMPSHYWIETGDYGAAIRSSDRAYALIVRLESTPDGEAHVQQYLKHDVAVGYAAAMMLENYAIARMWAQRMASADDIGFDAITALRFGDAATAYAARDPQYGNAAVHGWAALLLGRRKEADAIAQRLVASKTTGGYVTPLFLARVADAHGDASKAQQWIARAADEQRRDFAGELIPLIPASEELGTYELRSGDRAAAETAFEQALALYPNDPRAIAAITALER
jgi:Tfp pilus assembly protein PilF